MKPIIKWVGGKTQIIDTIITNFPTEIYNYHELFVGGGSVMIALLENIRDKKIKLNGTIYAYDINPTLINLYKNIQTNPQQILIEIKKLITTFTNISGKSVIRKPQTEEDAVSSQESYYYWIRQQFNNMTQEQKNSVCGTAYFIFLNKTCFRGLYREGPNGFNVPYGNYKNPEIISDSHLISLSVLVKNVVFAISNFKDSFGNVGKNDFVYLDPPYVPENKKSFVGYVENGFNAQSHKLLFDMCVEYKFMMSNSDTKLVRDSFSDKKYRIITIMCKRSINSKKPDSKTNELIICSY